MANDPRWSRSRLVGYMAGRYWIETLGCPKNQVDSDKLAGTLQSDGLEAASEPGGADVVVINTCAFIESARQESVETILDLAERRRPGARLVVTGCLAERYGHELADALPEVDLVAGFGVPLSATATPVALRTKPTGRSDSPSPSGEGEGEGEGPVPSFDLLNLPRPPVRAPWAYVKVAEGCDRHCGFCAIPSFRGRQRSRAAGDILAEVEALAEGGVAEVVLVAQDLASYGRDLHQRGAIVDLLGQVSARVARTRLLYLYPSELTDRLIDAIGETGCPYFDLSLQHVSRVHLRRMRRWGDGDRFTERLAAIRARYPDAAFRSSFIVGYPGETEEDHDQLLRFLEQAELDWAGFFAYSAEEGTYAAGLEAQVPADLMAERLAEAAELQDAITSRRRLGLVGSDTGVLVDRPGIGRSHREAPEIDGIIRVPRSLPVGSFAKVTITAADGPDLESVPVGH